MVDFPIAIADAADFGRAENKVENCCRRLGLVLGMKTTSAKHPGSIHWHFKRPAQSGTLEITVWPSKRRAWMTVRDGRKAEWMREVLPILGDQLERAFARG
jgi:hypothetical protein